MKIALVNALYHPNELGGAERVVRRLAEDLVAVGNEVLVLTTGPKNGVHTRDVNSVTVRQIGLRNLYWPFGDEERPTRLKPAWHAIDSYNPAMMRTVRAILREERPDVVNTHNLVGFSVAMWSAAKSLGLPLVHTIHDYYLMCPRASMFRRGRNCERQCHSCHLYSLSRRRLSSHVDGVIGVSRYVLDAHYRRGYFPNASVRRVVYNQAEPEGSGPSTTKTSTMNGRTENGHGPLRIGYLGRLLPSKGLEGAVRALAMIPGDTWSLSVGGKADSPVYERELVRTLTGPNVAFLGAVDADRFLRSVDVLLVPSLWQENSPRVIYEAFAHGVPVICSDRGGVPELVEEGETGFLFDPEKPGELTAHVRGILDRREILVRMSSHCAKAAARFAPEHTVRGYLSAYQDVLAA